MSAQPSIAKAALWMAGWLSLMLLLTVAGREATPHVDVFQIMEMRAIIGLLVLYPLVRAAGGFASVRTKVLGQHVGRNVVHYGAQFAWFYALTLIPLAQLISIEFTMPIWTALFAALFLGERITGWKAASIVLGLAGVAIIVRPGVGEIELGQLVALAAALGFGISVTMVKSLTRHDSVTTIIFWMLVVQAIIGFVPALLVWQWPPAAVWPWIVVIGFCGTFSHYCMTRALAHADATVVVPMDFLRVPLTAFLGWALYMEALDGLTVAGALLILFGNSLNLRRGSTARIPAASD